MGRERQIQKNEETRKAIIDAAVSIGLEEGFEELSIRKITDRLGYSAGIVYYYFKDKQEILDTIHNTTSMELMDAVDVCIREDRSFAENTKVVFKMLSEISIYEPEMFKLILLNRYSPNNESIQTWLKMIRHCIEIGINTGELRDVDPEIVSYIMLNSFLVAQMIITEKDNIDEKMIEHVFDTELDIILKLSVEPYEYYDRDVIFTIDSKDFLKLVHGKLDPVFAFTVGKLKVSVVLFISSICLICVFKHSFY